MTFHSIVKHWCEIYKFMRHSKNNKRFFLTDSPMGVVDMAHGLTSNSSPCVMFESTVQGGGLITRPDRTYPIYFFVRADKMADGDAAAVAKEEAWMHSQNFLAWLMDKRNKELRDNIDGDFARIDLGSYVTYDTVGPLENGWFGVCVQLEREEPLNLCINDDLYVDDCECDDDGFNGLNG